MKLRKSVISACMATVMTFSMLLAGCGNDAGVSPDNTTNPKVSATEEVPADGHYVELAVNVYYNDADHNYYANEAGSEHIIVTKDGQYSVSFDCDTDLSDAAVAAGVNSLNNLTAIYLLDMGSAEGKQSPITAAQIRYDSVEVDGTKLTVTQTESKSAIKSSGIFDTNDPINAWDGSCVSEVDSDTATHVANFSTVTDPKKITITFTISGIEWEKPAVAEPTKAPIVVDGKNGAKFSDMNFKNMTALEVSKYMGNGINLGNTMEATLSGANPKTTKVSSFETAWGQPITTPEMIQGMKSNGFDTLRIPVAWANCIDYKNGDFTLRTDLLDRIGEIVNYALDAEMFVIVNDHWDSGWWSMFGSSDQATVDTAWTLYEEMWKQIADYFKDYPDMLIFESANEQLGDDLNNNSNCPTSGSLTKDDQYRLTNEINQKFVDIVRASGGNNTDRFLLLAGYNTNIDNTCDARFKMPEDTATSKLFLSVHYYNPWSYCGDKQAETEEEAQTCYARWGIKNDFSVMEECLEKMTKFTDQGYGIIIGEYGALPVYLNSTKTSLALENSDVYTAYLLDLCEIYNYIPVLWATNDSYNKNTLKMLTDELAFVFSEHRYEKQAAAGDAWIDMLKEEMAGYVEAAPDHFEVGGETFTNTEPVAYIMWSGGAGSYNVGDTYTPNDCAASIIPHDVVVTGAGEYSVGLDFTNGNDGLSFGALALNAGEDNFPGCILDIKSVIVKDKDGNETQLKLIRLPYTSSDDKHCTRVNLINEWVSQVPDDARNKQNVLGDIAGPVILDKQDLVGIYNITINFELIEK